MSVICTLPEGGVVTVQFAESGRSFRRGDRVDLDAIAAPGVTWREALGAHADAAFGQEPVEETVSPRRRTAASTQE
jgi:hypothetical protein